MAVATAEVQGRVDPAFEGVRAAFEENFASNGEVGAALSVYRDGEPVVDLWGGVADRATGEPWREDSVALAYSVTKGATTVCMNRLIEAGRLDPALPVSHYWPEFAQAGKEAITVEEVMSHRAGLAAIDGVLTLEEVIARTPVLEAIARQAPNWPPGSRHGYHARSFGWILGEVLRRIDGRTLGRYWADEVAGPLKLDFWIGFPAAQSDRLVRLVYPEAPPAGLMAPISDSSLLMRVMTGPSGLFGYNEMWQRPDLLASEMPSSNGVGDARAMARMYAACLGPVDGIRLLSPERLADAVRLRSSGPDAVIGMTTAFGLGFARPPMLGSACPPSCFGHPGAGGATAFADPDSGIAFSYLPSRMLFDPAGDPRSNALIQAVYASV